MWLTLIILIIPVLLLVDYTRKKKRYDITSNIPGPKIYPFIGNLFIVQQKNAIDAVNFMIDHMKNYGPTVRIWMMNQLIILSQDPKVLEVILSSPKYIKKNSLYDFLNDWLGTGLLLSNGKKWFSRRKIITPTFHFKILEEFTEIFDEHSTVLAENLQVHSNKKEFNINPYITLAALDVISETAMGTKINAQTNPDSEYAQAVTDITDVIMGRFVNVSWKSNLLFKFLAPEEHQRQTKAIKVLHDFTENIINERRRTLLSNNNVMEKDENVQDDVGTKRKMALLDVLLQATINEKPLTNDDIREEVDTFMFEGHDTTTAGIGFTLYCISRHPSIQDKLFAEIRDIIGDDKKTPVGLRELNDLKYLELVLKESMRLYPPVPIIGRRLEEDVTINGHMFPNGTNITIPIFNMLKDPKYFPDPEKFDPERHNTNEKLNPYVYIPFSAGPRNCIGQKFAMLEMKSVISKILRHYELLALGSDPEPIINLVLRSTNGIHLGIKPRVYV